METTIKTHHNGTHGSDPLALDFLDFSNRILSAYGKGTAEKDLPADLGTATSWIPAATGNYRDFSYIAPELPEFFSSKCVGCMECVTECPDTAILAKVLPSETFNESFNEMHDESARNFAEKQIVKTTKYYDVPAKKGEQPGMFMIAVDPSKCKGCGECVIACGEHDALKMVPKTPENLDLTRKAFTFYEKLPATPKVYIQEKVLADMMLSHDAMLYTGGAGSCMGCGEATALRMMLAATGYLYGAENTGIVAATGCNTVYGSTYPYTPFRTPWTNSLFENAPAVSMGIRGRWNQLGWTNKKLWVVGGDGAMLDIGFQSLSRMLMSGMDINVIVLDTQVYSNTGGQTSTASFVSQDAKMSSMGKSHHGKSERRKELAQVVMMHPDVFVAQTTCAHINHFYRAIAAANSYPGPALVNVYTPCQPEHGIADNASMHQSKLAVDSRAFPLLIHDPRKGETLAERLSLQGNPAMRDDWFKTSGGETIDFVAFARTEGRFAKQFHPDGTPSDELLKAQEDRRKNWRLLQELARVR
ncbi:MAG TPA: thiamine pyrophosphate-dependent enzyme [Candidatus Kapabacteria bacterium]|nr:thiamine pyrophosphate-dependent enzyme [Candidatus Kapabacteria bacterium]